MQAAAGREDKTVELIGRVLGVEVGERCLVSRFRFFFRRVEGQLLGRLKVIKVGWRLLGETGEATSAVEPVLSVEFEKSSRGKYSQAELERISKGIDGRIVYRIIKRLFDIAFSLLVLICLLPLHLVIALAIWIDDPHASPLFFQEREGRHGKMFRMVKFRSMYADAEERLGELLDANEKDGPVFKIKGDPRITRVGKFIRKTSLDELPQFWNVLVGGCPSWGLVRHCRVRFASTRFGTSSVLR